MNRKPEVNHLEVLAKALAIAILNVKREDFANFIRETKTESSYENVRSLSPV